VPHMYRLRTLHRTRTRQAQPKPSGTNDVDDDSAPSADAANGAAGCSGGAPAAGPSPAEGSGGGGVLSVESDEKRRGAWVTRPPPPSLAPLGPGAAAAAAAAASSGGTAPSSLAARRLSSPLGSPTSSGALGGNPVKLALGGGIGGTASIGIGGGVGGSSLAARRLAQRASAAAAAAASSPAASAAARSAPSLSLTVSTAGIGGMYFPCGKESTGPKPMSAPLSPVTGGLPMPVGAVGYRPPPGAGGGGGVVESPSPSIFLAKTGYVEDVVTPFVLRTAEEAFFAPRGPPKTNASAWNELGRGEGGGVHSGAAAPPCEHLLGRGDGARGGVGHAETPELAPPRNLCLPRHSQSDGSGSAGSGGGSGPPPTLSSLRKPRRRVSWSDEPDPALDPSSSSSPPAGGSFEGGPSPSGGCGAGAGQTGVRPPLVTVFHLEGIAWDDEEALRRSTDDQGEETLRRSLEGDSGAAVAAGAAGPREGRARGQDGS